MIKRLFDVTVACVLLIPAAAICILAGLLVFVSSGHNPLFTQLRVGKGRAPFKLYKLRTMVPEMVDVGSHEACRASVTRVGRLLRKVKLDEVPQLICVLRGEMSLVGPRPCLPSQQELIDEREKLGVFKVRPGITGLAQVQGIDMSTPRELAKVDAEYVENLGLLTDLRLMLRTVKGGGRGDAIL